MPPVSKELALYTLEQIHGWQREFLSKHNTRFVYAADELYIKAGMDIPKYGEYEDFPQLENGVGMLACLLEEWDYGIGEGDAVVTGKAAAFYLRKLTKADIIEVENNFFGHAITVSGLVVGRDIAEQFPSGKRYNRVCIPSNMLRHGTDVFLDDMTVSELEQIIGNKIEVFF
jgi:NifB/MoaA-like Fe-S oxidoreductase